MSDIGSPIPLKRASRFSPTQTFPVKPRPVRSHADLPRSVHRSISGRNSAVSIDEVVTFPSNRPRTLTHRLISWLPASIVCWRVADLAGCEKTMLRQQNPDSLLGLGKKRTQPHDAGAEHDIPARPQGAIKDDSSKLACLCYPGDGPDEFLAARVFNEGFLRPRDARARGTHRSSLPWWGAFSASC